MRGLFSPISAASFSPIRPSVFAATSSDGFLYIYDLTVSQLSPAAVLECPLHPPATAAAAADGGAGSTTDSGAQSRKSASKHSAASKRGGAGESTHNRVSITGLAFNHKQRGLIAACDYLGRVHIWKLSWKLSNIHADEQNLLDAIGNINITDELLTDA